MVTVKSSGLSFYFSCLLTYRTEHFLIFFQISTSDDGSNLYRCSRFWTKEYQPPVAQPGDLRGNEPGDLPEPLA